MLLQNKDFMCNTNAAEKQHGAANDLVSLLKCLDLNGLPNKIQFR